MVLRAGGGISVAPRQRQWLSVASSSSRLPGVLKADAARDYNGDGFEGSGSCIFAHYFEDVARGPEMTEESRLEEVVQWPPVASSPRAVAVGCFFFVFMASGSRTLLLLLLHPVHCLLLLQYCNCRCFRRGFNGT